MASAGLWSSLMPEGKIFLADDDGAASEVLGGSCSIAASVASFCLFFRPKSRCILPRIGIAPSRLGPSELILLVRCFVRGLW